MQKVWRTVNSLRFSDVSPDGLEVLLLRTGALYSNLTFAIEDVYFGVSQTGFDSRQKGFLFSWMFRSTLGSTEPPVCWILEASLKEESGRDVKLTTHLRLMPKFVMRCLIKRRNNFAVPFVDCIYHIDYWMDERKEYYKSMGTILIVSGEEGKKLLTNLLLSRLTQFYWSSWGIQNRRINC